MSSLEVQGSLPRNTKLTTSQGRLHQRLQGHPAADHPAADHPAADHPAADHPAADHPVRDRAAAHLDRLDRAASAAHPAAAAVAAVAATDPSDHDHHAANGQVVRDDLGLHVAQH